MSMKIVTLFLAVVLLAACSSPKKTVEKAPSPTVTRADKFRGGTSFSNPVVIMVSSESTGIAEEYKWLSNNYAGYGLIRKSRVQRASKNYEIFRIKTKSGELKDIYFDISRFVGRN